MKRSSAIFATFAVLGASAFGAEGCSSSNIPIAAENSNLYGGPIDAGTGLCGKEACSAGELCCAGSDELCSPTCMKTDKCPIYGRACKIGDAGSGDSGATDGGTTGLAWYATCGGPLCRTPDGGPDAGPPPVCPTEGTPCTQKGLTCGDGSTTCGSIMVCEDHDPKVPGCPISSAKFKDDIRYLSDRELAALHDETLNMHLASYRYKPAFAKGAPESTHLGFIIEDQPESMSVERGHDRVDMYGYLSMAIATLQVENKEIAELKKELEKTRRACELKK